MKVVNSSNHCLIIEHFNRNINIIFDFRPFFIYVCIFVFLLIIVFSVYYLYRELKKEERPLANPDLALPEAHEDKTPECSISSEHVIIPEKTPEISLNSLLAGTSSTAGKRNIIAKQYPTLSMQSLKRSDNLFTYAKKQYLDTGYSAIDSSNKKSEVQYGLLLDPPAVFPCEMVNIYISVYSTALQDRSCRIDLSIDGQLLYTEDMHILPHCSRIARFPIYTANPGVYKIEVNGVIAFLQVYNTNETIA